MKFFASMLAVLLMTHLSMAASPRVMETNVISETDGWAEPNTISEADSWTARQNAIIEEVEKEDVHYMHSVFLKAYDDWNNQIVTYDDGVSKESNLVIGITLPAEMVESDRKIAVTINYPDHLEAGEEGIITIEARDNTGLAYAGSYTFTAADELWLTNGKYHDFSECLSSGISTSKLRAEDCEETFKFCFYTSADASGYWPANAPHVLTGWDFTMSITYNMEKSYF